MRVFWLSRNDLMLICKKKYSGPFFQEEIPSSFLGSKV